MRILVIDDERTLENIFADTKTSVIYVRNYHDAAMLLFGNPPRFDVVYLDHDLGDGPDGGDLTAQIEERAYKGELLDIGKFVIHSMNPIGRMRMYNALHRFYNVEFARAEDLL